MREQLVFKICFAFPVWKKNYLGCDTFVGGPCLNLWPPFRPGTPRSTTGLAHSSPKGVSDKWMNELCSLRPGMDIYRPTELIRFTRANPLNRRCINTPQLWFRATSREGYKGPVSAGEAASCSKPSDTSSIGQHLRVWILHASTENMGTWLSSLYLNLPTIKWEE